MAMTETEARAALAAFDAVGDLERWIAGQPWQATPDGWTVLVAWQGWRFRLQVAPGGVRVLGSDGWGEPMVWIVPGPPPRTGKGHQGA